MTGCNNKLGPQFLKQSQFSNHKRGRIFVWVALIRQVNSRKVSNDPGIPPSRLWIGVSPCCVRSVKIRCLELYWVQLADDAELVVWDNSLENSMR